MNGATPTGRQRLRAWWLALVIVAAGTFAFSPAFRGEWLWDDEPLISENQLLRDVAGLRHIWVAPQTPDYFPLTSTVQWLEWHLWGDNPFAFHLATLAGHLVAALLLWGVLHQLGVPCAWLGGLVFAVHPLTVESVAWVAEQKNTLSLPLLLLALLFHLEFDTTGRRRDHWLAVVAFALALLAKTSVAMLPVVLLLHAWWRRGRVTLTDVRASLPFFALSLALGMVTVWFQHTRAIASWSVPVGGIDSRIAGAGLALAFYLWKSVWPVGLLPIYPRWSIDPPAVAQFLPWLGLAVAGAWCWMRRAKPWARHAIFGFGCFVINLAPVLGFVTIAWMHFAWVGDHLAYIALAPLVGLATAAVGAALERWRGAWRHALAGGVAAGVIALACHTYAYAHVFRTKEEFCTYTLARNPDAWVAHLQLGTLQIERGEDALAREHFAAALRLRPDDPDTHNNYGYALLRQGRDGEAMAQFEEALRLRPTHARANYNYGCVLLRAGRNAEATTRFEAALRQRPSLADAERGLGSALAASGRGREAAEHFATALRLDPRLASAHLGLGEVLASAGEHEAAVRHYRTAATLAPELPEPHYNLGNGLLKQGAVEEAMREYREALRLRPDYADARVNLGNALAQSGRAAEAIAEYEAALRVDPAHVDAHANLGVTLAEAGRVVEALPHFETAVRLRPGQQLAHVNLANALLAAGRAFEARRHYEEALRLDPACAPAREMLARLPRADGGKP
jgi:tetratricopeptide (TPR) repeat protein